MRLFYRSSWDRWTLGLPRHTPSSVTRRLTIKQPQWDGGRIRNANRRIGKTVIDPQGVPEISDWFGHKEPQGRQEPCSAFAKFESPPTVTTSLKISTSMALCARYEMLGSGSEQSGAYANLRCYKRQECCGRWSPKIGLQRSASSIVYQAGVLERLCITAEQ